MIKAVISEPGAVPYKWNFVPEGDKERIWCMLCHQFKPDR